MAKVGLKNIFEPEDLHLEVVEKDYLLPAVHAYAVLQNKTAYNLIMRERVSLQVNGKIVHPDDWYVTEVQEQDEILVVPVLSGGDTGAMVQIGLGIALMIAAPYLAGVAFVYGGVAVGTAATIANVAMGMGISLALGGISSLLFSPDLPSVPSFSGGSAGRSTQTYNWSGISTTARYDTPIPVVYGTHKIGGNLVSVYTNAEGNYSYLNMLIALCEGEIDGICQANNHKLVCTTTDNTNASYVIPAIEINDQPFSMYTDISWWYRKGTNTASPLQGAYNPSYQTKIPYFGGAVTQFDDGREISVAGIEYRTSKPVDHVIVQNKSPLLYTMDSNGLQEHSIDFHISYRKVGDVNWTSLSSSEYQVTWIKATGNLIAKAGDIRTSFATSTYKYGDVDTTLYTLKVLHNHINWGQIESDITSKTERYTLYTIECSVTNNRTGEVLYLNAQNGVRVYDKILHYGGGIDVSVGMMVEHQTAAIYFGQMKVWVEGWCNTGAEFDISPTLTGRVGTDLRISGKTQTGLWYSTDIEFADRAIYDIKVWRDVAPSTSDKVKDNLELTAVTEIVNGDFIYPNTALLGLRMKATDQLSGGIPNITTVVRGIKVEVPDLSLTASTFDDYYWNNSQWEDEDGNAKSWDNVTYVNQHSANSMLCLRDLMLNTRYGIGDYITDPDLSVTGVITAIKDCHQKWTTNSATTDLMSWWSDGDATEWGSHFSVSKPVTPPVTYVASPGDRFIDMVATKQLTFSIKDMHLTRPVQLNDKLNFAFNTASLQGKTGVSFVGKKPDGTYKTLSSTSNITTTGTYTATITAPFEFNDVVMYVSNINPQRFVQGKEVAQNWGIRINDLSLIYNATYIDSHHNHSFNGVFDAEQSALTAVAETCDSYRCWPIWRDGKFDFVIDKDETPSHTVTQGNMKEFSQSFSPVSEIPYELVGQYTDAADRYNMTSLVARSSMTDLTKANTKTIGLKGITDRATAERETIFRLNKATNCVRAVSFKTALDTIHCTAGDLISVQSDLPQWGQGGRLLDYDIPTSVTVGSLVTATFSVTADTADGRIKGNSLVSWANARVEADEIQSAETGSDYYSIGAFKTGGNEFFVFRTWLPFDLSTVATGVCDSATLVITSYNGQGADGTRAVCFQKGTAVYPLDAADVLAYTGAEVAERINLFQWGADTVHNVILNTVGTLAISENLGATAQFCLRESQDVDNAEPTSSAISAGMYYADNGTADLRPKLKMTVTTNTDVTTNTPGKITFDKLYTLTYAASSHVIIYQNTNNSYVTATIDTTGLSDGNSIRTASLVTWVGSPCNDAVYTVGVSGNTYRNFRIVSSNRTPDNDMEFSAINHVASVYNASTAIAVEVRNDRLPNVTTIPQTPINVVVTQTNLNEGIGFYITAKPVPGDFSTKEIIVKMSENAMDFSSMSTIGFIAPDQGSLKYVDNSLRIGNTYHFSLVSRTAAGLLSQPVSTSCTLRESGYTPNPPSGLAVKNTLPNSEYFDGKDAVITWNPVGAEGTNTMVTGYVVEVYGSTGAVHAAGNTYSLLRTAFCRTEEYKYTVEMNIADGGPYKTLRFKIYTQAFGKIISEGYAQVEVENAAPDDITGLAAKSIVGGVEFNWDKSAEQDHYDYKCSRKVGGAGDWTSYFDVANNSYKYVLTSSDITSYTTTASVWVRVKDYDWYNQTSATYVEIGDDANVISDSIFDLAIDSDTGAVQASLNELINGVTNDGGVYI